MSTDSTGGGGFTFADHVAADLLLLMLLGRPLRGSSAGHIEEIQFECHAKGWRFDDWMITYRLAGTNVQRAYSCKSNAQFSKTKAPRDSMARLWQQLDAPADQNPFRWEHDQLILVTAPLDPTTKSDLDHLLNAARGQDVDTFVANATHGLGKSRIAMLKSLSRDPSLLDPRSAWRALNALAHHPYDHLQDGSQCYQQSLELARSALIAPTAEDALDLWNDLVAMASTARVNAAVLQRSDVIHELRPKHRLAAHPDFTGDISKLRRYSDSATAQIRTEVGAGLSLSRKVWLQQLTDLGTGFYLTAAGDSGAGKSALIKLYARSHAESGRLLWINADVFNERMGLESLLDLQHPLADLLDEWLSSTSLVVVDATERVSGNEAEVRFTGFLKQVVNRPALRRPTVVLTVQRADKERLLAIARSCYPDDMRGWVLPLEGLLASELEQIAKVAPSLRPHLTIESSRRVLSNLKTLDLLLRLIDSAQLGDPAFRVTEEWIKNRVIDSALQSMAKPIEARQAVTRLAEGQATHGQYALPQDRLEQITLTRIDDLVQTGMVRHHDGRFTFDHDIIGDWLRASTVPESAEDLRRYISQHLHRPVWMRAARMKLRWLAERSAADYSKRFAGLVVADPDGQLLDMLLDGVLLASNSSELLDACQSLLLEGSKPLLRDALIRAMHSGTEPDSRVRELAAESQKFSDVLISAHVRRPRQVVVEPLIRWLAANKKRALDLAFAEVSNLCRMWLSSAPRSLSSRKPTADLAIASVAHAFAIDALRGYRMRDDSQVFEIYAALCLAVIDEPVRAKAVLRALAGRTDIPLPKKLPPELKPWKRPPGLIPFPSFDEFAPEEEVDVLAKVLGPKWTVPDSFREFVVRHGYAMAPILAYDPQLASELILAVLIRAPGRRPRRRHYATDFDLELESDVRDYPPYFDRGPFHHVFAYSPDVGVDLVVKLCHFAYDRWLEESADEEDEARSADGKWTPETVRVRQHLLFAHRDVGMWPNILVSALMALEKFITVEADKGVDIDPLLNRVLGEHPNQLLFGVCLSVAKKYPALLKEPLLSLAVDEELLLADYMQLLQGEGHQIVASPSMLRGAPTFDQTRDWHRAPYRSIQVAALLAKDFATSPELEAKLNRAAGWWSDARPLPGPNEQRHWLELAAMQMRAIFTSVNWQQADGPTRTFHAPPEMIAARDHATQAAAQSNHELTGAHTYRMLLEQGRPLSEDESGHVLGVLQEYLEESPSPDDIERSANRVAIVMYCICLLAERTSVDKFMASESLASSVAKKAAETVADPRYQDDLTSILWFEPFARAFAHLSKSSPNNSLVRRTLGQCLASARGTVLAAMGHAFLTPPVLSATQVRCALGLLTDLEALDLCYRMYRYGEHEPTSRRICTSAREESLERFVKGVSQPPPILQDLISTLGLRAGLPAFDQLDWTIPVDRVVALANWTDGVLLSGPSHPYYAISELVVNYMVSHFETPPPDLKDGEKHRERTDVPTDGERRGLEMVSVSQLCRWRDKQPWLELHGLLANASFNEHHIEEYLDGLFEFAPRIFGDRIAEELPGFLAAFHKSLEATPGWSINKQWLGHTHETLWCGAIGVTRWRGTAIWQRYSATTVEALRPIFAAWAAAHLHRPHCAVHFLPLMQRDEFKSLLLDCIKWLHHAHIKAGEEFWDSYGDSPIENAAEFLEKCWNERRAEIDSDPTLSASYATLVGVLSARHNKIAMTLWDKLGG